MKIDKKVFDSCSKCGFVFDIEILGKKEINVETNDDLESYLRYEGFIPWSCPNCKNFNNYRED